MHVHGYLLPSVPDTGQLKKQITPYSCIFTPPPSPLLFQTRSQLQADLFSAQCRVELLEKEIRSLQSSARRRRSSGAGVDADVDVDVRALLAERDELLAARHSLRHKVG